MKQFQRRQEDFVCEHCGFHVKGNGYTNHCPRCLYSKHVDINPGDRAEECGGLMEPIDLILKDGEYVLIHRCQKCGFERRNKVSKDDDFEAILQIARQKKEQLKK